jgi:hypothetical protein
LSACRGVTDALLNSVTLAERPDGDFMAGAIEELWKRHEKLAAELLSPAACETYCECSLRKIAATSPACCRRCG